MSEVKPAVHGALVDMDIGIRRDRHVDNPAIRSPHVQKSACVAHTGVASAMSSLALANAARP